MTSFRPSDRIKEIESDLKELSGFKGNTKSIVDTYEEFHNDKCVSHIIYLIARVRRLEKALEFYASPWGEHFGSPIKNVNKFTQEQMNRTCEVARVALSEEVGE